MKRILLLLLVLPLLFACNTRNSQTLPSPATTTSAATPTPHPSPSDELRQQVEQIVAAAKGKVGVAAVLLGSDRSASRVLVELNERDHYPMQSVYKVPISMAVLKQVESGRVRLDQKVRVTKAEMIGRAAHSPIRDKHPNGAELTVAELMRFAVGESDGTASDVLMKLAGGPEAIMSYLRELGVNDMMVVNTEFQFSQDSSFQYQNWTTPQAAVALLQALNERRALNQESTALLLKLMVESKPGARRLKGQLPAGTVVAHKTGTSGTEKGVTAATNDIGIITLPDGRSVAIAVFVSESPENVQVREVVIAGVAKAVWDHVNKNQ